MSAAAAMDHRSHSHSNSQIYQQQQQQYQQQSPYQQQQQQPQQQQEGRPRSKSSFSFKSDKSNDADKRKSHFTPGTKANPNAAMNEAQPIAAALEKPTLQSLRAFQHNDSNGVPIAEPDLSNPTRSRWERPLDTIRSFEAAIDSEYRRRSQAVRAQSSTDLMSGYTSRRSSYYGGYDQNRYSQVSGYYNSRQPGRDSWADNGNGYAMGGPVGGPPRAQYQRTQTDPRWNRYSTQNRDPNPNPNQNVYPNNAHQQSRDTVNTNGSNGSHSDPYSTDPSSENSSIERPLPVNKPDMGEQYGFQGFGGEPILEEYDGGPANDGYFQPQYPSQAPSQLSKQRPPPPPAHRTMPLNGGGGNNSAQAAPALARNDSEKRRSWFKRRFSRD